jgi:hypothetical protein
VKPANAVGRLKTAEGFIEYSAPQIAGRDEPFRSAIREHQRLYQMVYGTN